MKLTDNEKPLPDKYRLLQPLTGILNKISPTGLPSRKASKRTTRFRRVSLG